MADHQESAVLTNNKEQVLRELHCLGAVSVLRVRTAESLQPIVAALVAGGMRAIEVTLTTPRAIELIAELAEKYSPSEILLGAGTVVDVGQAEAAIDAGARYIVAPTINLDVIEYCRDRETVVIPGAFTPTEIETAWRAGADIVKVFPANIGGPTYFKDLAGPLPQIKLIPSGGVDFQTAPAFLAAGAFAVAVGGAVIGRDFERLDAMEEIRTNAARFVELLAKSRKPK